MDRTVTIVNEKKKKFQKLKKEDEIKSILNNYKLTDISFRIETSDGERLLIGKINLPSKKAIVSDTSFGRSVRRDIFKFAMAEPLPKHTRRKPLETKIRNEIYNTILELGWKDEDGMVYIEQPSLRIE